MEIIVELVVGIAQALLSLLPSSPFLWMMSQIEEIDILGVINWFIPFDICAGFMNIWLVSVGVYLVCKTILSNIDMVTKIKGLFH